MKRKTAARKPQHDAATACAKDVLARWLAGAAYATPERINGGGCDAFCSDLEHEIRTRFPGINDIEGYYVASFLAVDQATGDAREGGPLDWGMLKKHWPGVAPCAGTTMADWNALSEWYPFDPGTHTFLHVEGLFYDAECVNGTRNFLELPFLLRAMAAYQEELKATPSP